MIRYASVCSGIEAATAAWHPLGWQAQWFSEIEPNPCKVLQHHYPDIPNLGDMTALDNNEIYANSQFDLLVGGTPCQSFSVAGLRNGLDDERGNLALEFIRILMRKRPKWFLWENVPGVLSSTGGADFAAILSGFTGTDVEPQKFTTSGVISGPFYSVAWRVLDSQYIGVPQRRRRVFVVGHLGNDWRPPTAVLFERKSMRGHTSPRKRTRQETAGAAEGSAGTKVFRKLSITQFEEDTVSSTVARRDYKSPTDLVVYDPATYCISGNTVDRATKQNGTGVTDTGVFTLTKTDRHAIVYDTTKGCLNPSAPQAWRVHSTDSVSPCLDAGKPGPGTHIILAPNTQPIPINTMAVQGRPSDKGRMGTGIGEPGDPQNTLSKAHHHALFIPSHYIVRRLTPLECERLQGFPDNYTNVADLSDSARYAAIGNSMTVNVMRWIGKRINYVHYCLSL